MCHYSGTTFVTQRRAVGAQLAYREYSMTVMGINGPSASASPYFMARLYSGSDADQDGVIDFWESAFQDRYTVQYGEQLQNVQLCPTTVVPSQPACVLLTFTTGVSFGFTGETNESVSAMVCR